MAAMKQYEPASRGIHKGEPRFRCSWRNSDGTQLSKTIYGRKNAERFCKDMEKGFINVDTGNYLDVEIEQTRQTVQDAIIDTRLTRTFGKLAARFLNVKRAEGDTSPSTIAGYKSQLEIHILPTLGEIQLDDIGLHDIENMVMAIKTTKRKYKAGPRPINKCLVLVRSIFQYGIDLRWCSENPAKRKKIIKYQKREGRVLQPAELLRIIRNTEAPFDLAIKILAFSGCRRGECLGLQWRDINFEDGTIFIERTFKSARFGVQPVKTKQSRHVPISGELLRSLRLYAAQCGEVDPGDWLFPDSLAEPKNSRQRKSSLFPIGGDVLLRRFKDALRKSSLSDFVIHDMRHTVITMMSEAGIDAASAQGISGHSDLTTLQNVYTHSRMSGKRKAIDAVAEILAASSLPGRESGSISGIREKQQTA